MKKNRIVSALVSMLLTKAVVLGAWYLFNELNKREVSENDEASKGSEDATPKEPSGKRTKPVTKKDFSNKPEVVTKPVAKRATAKKSVAQKTAVVKKASVKPVAKKSAKKAPVKTSKVA